MLQASRPQSPWSPRSSRSSARRVVLVCALALGGAALGGCNRKTAGTKVAREDLALVPREADIAFMVNLNRARSSPLWKKLMEAREGSADAKREYEDFVKKCALDPLNQFDSLFVALPGDADRSHEYAMILRGSFASDAVLGCARRVARDNAKQELTEINYNGHKLYTTNDNDLITVLDKGLVAIGGKGWLRKVVDLHDGRAPSEQGAKDHKELVELLKRTRTDQAFWGAGLIPQKARESLLRNKDLGAAATMKSLFGSLDAQKGAELHLAVDLDSDAAANDMAGRIKEQLVGARKNANVQLMGLSGYFDTVKVSAQKNTLATDIELTQPQVEDLTTRLSGLAKRMLASVGGDLGDAAFPAGVSPSAAGVVPSAAAVAPSAAAVVPPVVPPEPALPPAKGAVAPPPAK